MRRTASNRSPRMITWLCSAISNSSLVFFAVLLNRICVEFVELHLGFSRAIALRCEAQAETINLSETVQKDYGETVKRLV